MHCPVRFAGEAGQVCRESVKVGHLRVAGGHEPGFYPIAERSEVGPVGVLVNLSGSDASRLSVFSDLRQNPFDKRLWFARLEREAGLRRAPRAP